MTRGHTRWRGDSIEVRVHAGQGHYVTATIPWQGGKRKTEKAANEKLTQLLGEVDGGQHGGPTDTFRALAEAWWKHRRRSWSPSTAAGYRSRLDFRILPHLGHLPVGKVTPAVLVHWLDEHAGESPASRQKSARLVRSILEHGRRIGWIARNPGADVLSVSVPPPNVHAPSVEDVARALTALERANPDAHMFVHLAAATGARRGELAGIKWDDLNGKLLTIRRSVVLDEHGKVQIRPYPKGRRPRSITLDAASVRLLNAHKHRANGRADACGVSLGGYVFATEPDGKHPWRPDRATLTWSRLRAKLDLQGVRLHDLRHFAATRLLDAGFAAADVAARLGHANPAITQRIYAHAIPARDEAMAKTMGKVMKT